MIIREAAEADLPQIYNLIRESVREIHRFGSFVSPTPENLLPLSSMAAHWVTHPEDGAAIVIESDRGRIEAISFAGDWKVPLDYDQGRAAHDLLVYIRPEFRGQGIVSKMHALEHRLLKRRGFKIIFCGVHYDNERAISSVLKSGFRPYEQMFFKEL